MPASRNDTVPPGTVARLIEQLQGRDPFEVQEELLPALRAVTEGLSEAALRTPEAAGKWSIIEVVQHLADTELAFGFRLRMILAQETPTLQAFEQDLWARWLHYREVRLEHALEQLAVLRAANLRIFSRLNEGQLDRVGIHSEAGPVSAGMLLYKLAIHDLAHRAQIERIKRAL